jgi:hypothetical protein
LIDVRRGCGIRVWIYIGRRSNIARVVAWPDAEVNAASAAVSITAVVAAIATSVLLVVTVAISVAAAVPLISPIGSEGGRRNSQQPG